MQHIDNIAVWKLQLNSRRRTWRRRLRGRRIGYLNSGWRRLRPLRYRKNRRCRICFIAYLQIGRWLRALGPLLS